MKTYLFAWNPKKWNWTTLEQIISQVNQTGSATEKWSVQAHKKIQVGDRVFLMRLGRSPKGIMASGYVASAPFLSPHWDGSGKLVERVMIDYDIVLDPGKDTLLSLAILEQGNLGRVNWTPQGSGVEIHPEVTAELETTWYNFLKLQKGNSFLSSEGNKNQIYSEGAVNQIWVTRYERNPHARTTCINHYGLSCVVCGFNFELEFGELGKDFIHVHHLKQISSMEGSYALNPVEDLRPVCPNCHAMIHKRKIPYEIDEIKKERQKARSIRPQRNK